MSDIESSLRQEVSLPAPDFSVVTHTGETFTLSQGLGKPVLLYAWGTFPLCMQDLNNFQRVINRYLTQDMYVLGISIADSLEKAAEIFQEKNYTFPTIGHNEFVLVEYEVQFCPTTIFIDRQGIIRVIQAGTITDEIFDQNMALILP